MNEQQRKFESYLDEQIAACKQRSQLFAEDDRMDEGNFEKVRANVYEIFKTILSVAERVCGKDDSAKRAFFLQKAEQIPAGWTFSYEKAKQSGDVEKCTLKPSSSIRFRKLRMCVCKSGRKPHDRNRSNPPV